jgi:tRNA1(Val) A37 N6-methylase TrmN6
MDSSLLAVFPSVSEQISGNILDICLLIGLTSLVMDV